MMKVGQNFFGGAMMEVLRRQELHAIWLGKKFARYLAAGHKLWIFDLSWFREGFHVDVLYLEIAG